MSVRDVIETKLRDAFSPTHLEVVNESHMHDVPPGSQTHFKVVVVSKAFEGLSSVKQHQLVYGALKEELGKKIVHGGIHALAITSRTPAEWAAHPKGNVSPLCASKSS